MKQASVYVAGVLVSLGIALAPLSASALGISFGGRIVGTIIPCISPSGPAFWFAIAPALGSKNVVFIWAPGAIGIPPVHPGQEILGLADVPYGCVIPIVPPIPLVGQRVQTDGVSI